MFLKVSKLFTYFINDKLKSVMDIQKKYLGCDEHMKLIRRYLMTFDQLEHAYYNAWYKDKFHEKAIKLAEQAYLEYPDHNEQILMDLIVFHGSMENKDQCIKYFNESLDKGYWYPAPYLSTVLHKSGYESQSQRWLELSKNIRNKPLVKVIKPVNYKSTTAMPLLVSLHGWGEDLELFSRFWKSDSISKDYIHLMIESSQQIGYKHFSWDDRQRAFKDIEQAINDLKGRYAIGNIIFAGFSQGSTTAIDLAFNSSLANIKGFIALCPNFPEKIKGINKTIRGVVITGDQDHAYKQQQEMISYFNDISLDCDFQVIKDFGHWFPVDLSTRLADALEYIKNH